MSLRLKDLIDAMIRRNVQRIAATNESSNDLLIRWVAPQSSPQNCPPKLWETVQTIGTQKNPVRESNFTNKIDLKSKT